MMRGSPFLRWLLLASLTAPLLEFSLTSASYRDEGGVLPAGRAAGLLEHEAKACGAV